MSAPRSGLVAVLFTDLVGSTELMSQLGDRAFDELRRKHFAALAKAVAAHGGEEVKNTGDGIMAVFPSAAEAVEAAVAMQQATARQGKESPLAIRVGVAVGDATAEDGDYFGTPVVEAARLVAAAQPGQILITQIGRALAGSRCTATFNDHGPLALKGLTEPVAVCEVAWQPAGSCVPMPALLTDVGRIFVGRDAELERMGQLWKEAVAGERRVVFLAGEPGVGKTRLAAELAVRIHEEDGIVLAGRCDEDLGVPYQPFVEALRHYVDGTEPEGLRGRLGRYGGELVRLVPELVEAVPDLAPALQSDPETERYRLFDAVAAWLSAVSAEDPLCFFVDDLQWATKPTLLLLRHIVRASDPRRLLIVGTYRDTELTHDHPLVELMADLRREAGVERIALSGLDDVAVGVMVEQVVGGGSEGGPGLVRAIYQETEGNPFFVREVLRHLTETNAIGRQGNAWIPQVPAGQLGIPEGVREVVGRRLTRLRRETNQALRVAAVVGPEFDVDLVQAAGRLSESELFGGLEEAIGARLVTETSPVRFRFSHSLVRATLYESLSGAHKIALHRDVARAIESLHHDALDDYLPALAYHWTNARVTTAGTGKAVEYARRAGDRAVAQLAHHEAAAYYRQAVELRQLAGAAPDAEHCALLISLGEAQRLVGDPAHRVTLLDAARLAQNLGDVTLLVRAALSNRSGLFSAVGTVDTERVAALETALETLGPADSPERARVLAALSIELHFAGGDRRLDLAREALAIARRLDDPATVAGALVALWLATLPVASAERAELAAQLAQISERINDPVVEFYVGLARFLTGLQLGDIVGADQGLDACRRIANDLGEPVLRWRATYLAVQRAFVDGQFNEAERLAREGLSIGEGAGQADATGFADIYLVRLLKGRFDEAIELARPVAERFAATAAIVAALGWFYAEAGLMDEARSIVTDLRGESFSQLRQDYLWTTTLSMLSRTCARLKDTPRAAELYDLLVAHHSTVVAAQSVWLGPLAYDLGLLAAALGRSDEADAHFAEAVEIHDRLGIRGMLAHTLLDWARTLLARRRPGDIERARSLLTRAHTTASELDIGHIEQQARALLEEIG